MLKKEAKKALQKHRKDQQITPVEPKKKTPKPEPPVVSEKLSKIKRCQNCYYCIGSHSLGSSVWCHCTNPGRSAEGEISKSWIKSKLNLPCWRPVPARLYFALLTIDMKSSLSPHDFSKNCEHVSNTITSLCTGFHVEKSLVFSPTLCFV